MSFPGITLTHSPWIQKPEGGHLRASPFLAPMNEAPNQLYRSGSALVVERILASPLESGRKYVLSLRVQYAIRPRHRYAGLLRGLD